MNSSPHILVTGATGKTGRRIIPRLTTRQVTVRAVSRHSLVPFDWTDPTTWDHALDPSREEPGR